MTQGEPPEKGQAWPQLWSQGRSHYIIIGLWGRAQPRLWSTFEGNSWTWGAGDWKRCGCGVRKTGGLHSVTVASSCQIRLLQQCGGHRVQLFGCKKHQNRTMISPVLEGMSDLPVWEVSGANGPPRCSVCPAERKTLVPLCRNKVDFELYHWEGPVF